MLPVAAILFLVPACEVCSDAGSPQDREHAAGFLASHARAKAYADTEWTPICTYSRASSCACAASPTAKSPCSPATRAGRGGPQPTSPPWAASAHAHAYACLGVCAFRWQSSVSPDDEMRSSLRAFFSPFSFRGSQHSRHQHNVTVLSATQKPGSYIGPVAGAQ